MTETATAGLEALLQDPAMTSVTVAAMQIFATGFVVLAIVSLALAVLAIAATWCIFKKAGTGGWKAIVPVYCDYTMYKIAWKTKYFWILLILSVVMSVCSTVMESMSEYALPLGIAILVMAIVVTVIEIKCQVKLAKAFRKGGWFAVGLIFLPFIFYPILGFGPAKYRRKRRKKKPLALPPAETME